MKRERFHWPNRCILIWIYTQRWYKDLCWQNGSHLIEMTNEALSTTSTWYHHNQLWNNSRQYLYIYKLYIYIYPLVGIGFVSLNSNYHLSLSFLFLFIRFDGIDSLKRWHKLQLSFYFNQFFPSESVFFLFIFI